MFKVSPFKLRMFEICPQQYKFYYLDDLAKKYRSAKPYLTMGAHVHNALHDFYAQLKPGERTWANLEKLLRKRWAENRQGFSDLEDERNWGLKALNMLKLYIHKHDLAITPKSLEDYYDFNLTPDICVLGRIDRVDQDAAGLQVIDYKTGKFSEEDVSDLQLKIYAMIMSVNLKAPITKASYLFLATHEWYTLNIDPEEFTEIKALILEKINRIQRETEFLPCPNKYCKHCDFLTICPKQEEIEEQLANAE